MARTRSQVLCFIVCLVVRKLPYQGITEDAKDYRDHAFYLLENYTVKNLVLNLNFNEANSYDTGADDIHYWMHPLADGGSKALFYLRYAFCSTQYAIDKISSWLI